MSTTPHLRGLLAASVSAIAISAIAGPVLAQTAPAGNVIEELVVTAQKKEEAIQDVPIAVSAFSGDTLSARKIEGGDDLLTAVPNVNYSKTNFANGFNFQIRGIGSKLVAASGDQGVAVHQNYVPLIGSNLADAEFYDVERVEVLRGPQGTLYGRNATGGAVNIISNKATDTFGAQITGEYGSYNTRKLKGYVNVPLGDWFSIRAAGIMLKRDGYGDNLVTGNDIDGRDIWSTRVTLDFHPSDSFSAWGLWEHFEEDDNRARIGKQLCATDVGPTSVGGVAISNTATPGSVGNRTQGFLSKGCNDVSLYDARSLGVIDSRSTLGGKLGNLFGVITGDAYRGKVQDPDRRNIESAFDPIYRSEGDLYVFNANWEPTEGLLVNALVSHAKGEVFTYQDYNRVSPLTTLNIGVFNDPQVGSTNQFRTFDQSSGDSDQTTGELRVTTDFDGPININMGGLFLNFRSQSDYFVFSNTLTIAAGSGALGPVPIDPNAVPDRSGHNYYDAWTPDYRLRSRAAFAEIYWRLSDDFKITAGGRYNRDVKRVINSTPNLLVPVPPGQPGQLPLIKQFSTFTELTGRIGFDWSPDLSFTDDSLIYGFYSRGYKPGGINSPSSVGAGLAPVAFDPEIVNAYEVGMKNTLMDGSMLLNFTGFYYDYKGYQVSKIVNRQSVNENIDARIFGLEAETTWEPIDNFRINGAVGYLDTKIKEGSSIDVLNRTQGNAALTLVNGVTGAGNCVVPTAQLAALIGLINANAVPPEILSDTCAGKYKTGTTAPGNPVAPAGIFVDPTDGVAADLSGNELPNSPHWTLSLGAQYTWELASDWNLTIRGDYYHQSNSFTRIFNTVHDKVRSWDNANFSLQATNSGWGLTVEGYVKNAFNKDSITDTYLTDDSSGLFTNIFIVDPRLYGVAITKRF